MAFLKEANKECIITQDSHLINEFLEVVKHCYLKNKITKKLYLYYNGYDAMGADQIATLIAIRDTNNHIIAGTLFLHGMSKHQTTFSILPTLLKQQFPKLHFTSSNYAFIRGLCVMPEHANRKCSILIFRAILELCNKYRIEHLFCTGVEAALRSFRLILSNHINSKASVRIIDNCLPPYIHGLERKIMLLSRSK